jgi:hypothetical protein
MNRLAERFLFAAFAIAVSQPAVPVQTQPAPSQRVTRAELVDAMNFVRQNEPSFEITATTNGSRFQGGTILRLARLAFDRNPDGPPLFIDHEDSFRAYLQVAGLTEAQAPMFVRKAYDHRQAQLIEYRRSAVIAAVEVAPPVELAVAVRASWPDTPGLPRSFSYEDTFSDPTLRVTNMQVVTYKLVKFKNFTLYDSVSGVYGKPTSGALGVLFWLLGDSRVLQSRSAITHDGLQIVLAHAKWGWFDKMPLVTIQKNGKAREEIDRGREDLREIEKTLKQEIRIRYR